MGKPAHHPYLNGPNRGRYNTALKSLKKQERDKQRRRQSGLVDPRDLIKPGFNHAGKGAAHGHGNTATNELQR